MASAKNPKRSGIVQPTVGSEISQSRGGTCDKVAISSNETSEHSALIKPSKQPQAHNYILPSIPMEEHDVVLGMISSKAVPIRRRLDGGFLRVDTGASVLRVSDRLNTFLEEAHNPSETVKLTKNTSEAGLSRDRLAAVLVDPTFSNLSQSLSDVTQKTARAILAATGTQATATGLAFGVNPILKAAIHTYILEFDLDLNSVAIAEVADLVSNMISGAFANQIYEIVYPMVEARQASLMFDQAGTTLHKREAPPSMCKDASVDDATIERTATGTALRKAMLPIDVNCPLAAAGWRTGQSVLKDNDKELVKNAIYCFMLEAPNAMSKNSASIILAERISEQLSPYLTHKSKQSEVSHSLSKALSSNVGKDGTVVAKLAVAQTINRCRGMPSNEGARSATSQTSISMASMLNNWFNSISLSE